MEKDLLLARQKFTHSKNSVGEISTCYNEFAPIFTQLKLRQIRSVPKGKASDCKFVRLVAEGLYENKLQELSERSTTNFARRISTSSKGNPLNQNKKRTSDDKFDIIQNMYNERLSYEDDDTILERHKLLNKHLNSAITNAKRTTGNQLAQGNEE